MDAVDLQALPHPARADGVGKSVDRAQDDPERRAWHRRLGLQAAPGVEAQTDALELCIPGAARSAARSFAARVMAELPALPQPAELAQRSPKPQEALAQKKPVLRPASQGAPEAQPLAKTR